MKKTLLYAVIPVFAMIGGAIALASHTSDIKTSLSHTLTSNIFPGSKSLNATHITYNSNTDLSDYSLHSSCDITSQFSSKNLNTYSFILRYNDANCGDDAIYLKDATGQVILNSKIKLHVYSDFELYNRLTDYSTPTLTKLFNSLEKKIQKNKIFSEYKDNSGISKYDFFSKKIAYHQYIYHADIIRDILSYRTYKYIVPVAGKTISTKESHLPNALRPYRSHYTDGIHHGWDVVGDKGDPTIALDNGIIIRVVNDFTKKDFSRIQYGEHLTQQQKLDNLDVLRGNQVWIKTMKGDVAFYSHLGDVFVEVGDIVYAGDSIGTIDVTGVPGDDYHDYHLHFPVHKNPYNSARAGKYSNDEIMNWPWYFKGESMQYIRKHQSEVFK